MPLLPELACAAASRLRAAPGKPAVCLAVAQNQWHGHRQPCFGSPVDLLDRVDPRAHLWLFGQEGDPRFTRADGGQRARHSGHSARLGRDGHIDVGDSDRVHRSFGRQTGTHSQAENNFPYNFVRQWVAGIRSGMAGCGLVSAGAPSSVVIVQSEELASKPLTSCVCSAWPAL